MDLIRLNYNPGYRKVLLMGGKYQNEFLRKKALNFEMITPELRDS